jgi:hypothetical protein
MIELANETNEFLKIRNDPDAPSQSDSATQKHIDNIVLLCTKYFDTKIGNLNF